MKIKLHLITEIYLLLCLLSGFFYEVSAIYLCLLIHEIGHFIMIKSLKKNIYMLEISPLGGILHIDKCQNDKNYKELLIYLSGPLSSLLLYLVFLYFNVNPLLVRSALYVLIMNSLPILPLDGGKIIMTIKQFIFPYRLVLKLCTFLSLIITFVLIIFLINYYNYVIILLFFTYLNCRYYYDIPEIYFSFLWYKYLYPNPDLKVKLLNTDKPLFNKFYKGYNHLFYHKNRIILEKEVLNNILKLK